MPSCLPNICMATCDAIGDNCATESWTHRDLPMSSDNGRMRLPKLRISTVMFLLLVAAGLLLVSIPGQIVEEPILNLCGQSEPTYGLEKMCHHGWPFAFLVRVATKTPTSPFGRLSLPASPSLRLSLWNLPEGIVRWSAWRLVADILVALLLLLAAGTMFERWRRRRGRFQLCLIDIFVISTAVACGFAYWATQAAERNRQAETVKQLEAFRHVGSRGKQGSRHVVARRSVVAEGVVRRSALCRLRSRYRRSMSPEKHSHASPNCRI